MKTDIVAAPSRRTVARAIALLVATLPLAALAGTPIDKRATADPTGTVEISNTAGSVMVTGWDRNEVEVTGELGKGTERLDFTKSDMITRIKVVLPNRSHNVDETDLIVKVPAGSQVSINTVSADIGVHAVRGTQRLQSVSGDMRTETSGEDLECRTVSGDVAIAGSGRKGLVSITTVSGNANATRLAGEVNGSTVSGDFTLAVGETTRSRLRSTSGNLTLQGSLAPDARVDIESISGDVRLDLVGKTGADYDVSSFSGEIRPCFGPKPVRTDEYAPGKEWRHQEGNATARVRIKTLSGDVGVCRK
jgi:DUF4097 and DUF4098 domain-containing protein YvlB